MARLKNVIIIFSALVSLASCAQDTTGYPGNIRADFKGKWQITSNGSYNGSVVPISTEDYSLVFGNIPFSGEYSGNSFTGDFTDTYTDGVEFKSHIKVSIADSANISGDITKSFKYLDSTSAETQHFTGRKVE